jgi:uncharacterized protein YyaL (SSP411 family)
MGRAAGHRLEAFVPNRLANETSPYLLQHANNPVDWYPWGEEALERARREDRPILLSIGYSACHWCHVMEHESFEDPETARLMNEHFVSIKVDREERPDLDGIYMSAVQAMTGHGGWPMTVFLTPEGVPFYGGTYFPPDDRHGLPSFKRLLRAIADAYRERPGEVSTSAAQLREFMQRNAIIAPSADEPGLELLDEAARSLVQQVDRQHGGFGGAPKFPQPMAIEFLLRQHARTGDLAAREWAELSLHKMAEGGIHDQLGGGFHRYSVDAHWAVPHFEKMLYDNALLSHAYLAAFQLGHDDSFRLVVEDTLDWVIREMTAPEGGFYSTLDADSEGEEGKFYVWTPEQVRQVLDEPAASIACAAFGISEHGNFEGATVLCRAGEAAQVARQLGLPEDQVASTVPEVRRRLLDARGHRVRPGRDEKVLTSWNGLMLRSFAVAARVLKRSEYREAAERNASFLLDALAREGRLLRTYRAGVAKLNAYLEDYANLADGLLALYEATFDQRWLREAVQLADSMIAEFWDESGAGFYDTGRSHEHLVVRPKDLTDNATPSGNSVAADVLLRLAILTGREDYRRRAGGVVRLVQAAIGRHPLAFGRMLCALDFYLGKPREIAIVGEPDAAETQALVDTVFSRFVPNRVIALRRPSDRDIEQLVPLLADRQLLGGRATAYVCQNYTCQFPVSDASLLLEQLSQP